MSCLMATLGHRNEWRSLVFVSGAVARRRHPARDCQSSVRSVGRIRANGLQEAWRSPNVIRLTSQAHDNAIVRIFQALNLSDPVYKRLIAILVRLIARAYIEGMRAAAVIGADKVGGGLPQLQAAATGAAEVAEWLLTDARIPCEPLMPGRRGRSTSGTHARCPTS